LIPRHRTRGRDYATELVRRIPEFDALFFDFFWQTKIVISGAVTLILKRVGSYEGVTDKCPSPEYDDRFGHYRSVRGRFHRT